MYGGRESSGCVVPTNDPNKCRQLQAEGREGRRLAEEIRRQGPELDTAPATPGALYCPRNAPTKLAGDVIIQGGNRVRYVASRIMWRPACKPRWICETAKLDAT